MPEQKMSDLSSKKRPLANVDLLDDDMARLLEFFKAFFFLESFCIYLGSMRKKTLKSFVKCFNFIHNQIVSQIETLKMRINFVEGVLNF